MTNNWPTAHGWKVVAVQVHSHQQFSSNGRSGLRYECLDTLTDPFDGWIWSWTLNVRVVISHHWKSVDVRSESLDVGLGEHARCAPGKGLKLIWNRERVDIKLNRGSEQTEKRPPATGSYSARRKTASGARELDEGRFNRTGQSNLKWNVLTRISLEEEQRGWAAICAFWSERKF